MTSDPPIKPSFVVLALRSAAYNVLFYVAMIGLMLIFVPLLVMPRHGTLWLARTWGLVSLWLLRVVVGTRIEFRGLDNIPAGPALFAPKHQSLLETFALLKHVPDFSYVLKRELTWIPFFGWYLMSARQIGIDRTSGRAALAQVVDGAAICFARGQSIFLFPEGTRRPVGAPPAYKKGVGTVYEGGQVPCVPVALDTGLFLAAQKIHALPGPLRDRVPSGDFAWPGARGLHADLAGGDRTGDRCARGAGAGRSTVVGAAADEPERRRPRGRGSALMPRIGSGVVRRSSGRRFPLTANMF